MSSTKSGRAFLGHRFLVPKRIEVVFGYEPFSLCDNGQSYDVRRETPWTMGDGSENFKNVEGSIHCK